MAAPNAWALLNANDLEHSTNLLRLKFRDTHWVCSGFLLNESTILTAAHCLATHTAPLRDLVIIENSAAKLQVFVEKIFLHPEYVAGNFRHDLGLLKIHPLPKCDRSYFLSKSIPFIGETTLFGAGKVSILPLPNYGWKSGKAYYLRALGKLFIFGGAAIAPNDSGGVATLPQSRELIGVMVGSTVMSPWNKILPAIGIAVPLNGSNLEFLKSHLKAE